MTVGYGIGRLWIVDGERRVGQLGVDANDGVDFTRVHLRHMRFFIHKTGGHLSSICRDTPCTGVATIRSYLPFTIDCPHWDHVINPFDFAQWIGIGGWVEGIGVLPFRLHITPVALVTGGGDEDHPSVREAPNRCEQLKAGKVQIDTTGLHIYIIRDLQAHINHHISALQITILYAVQYAM